MLSQEENEIYQRQVVLSEMGLAGQQKLKASSVLVVGAGGLGCPVLLSLASAGVGRIGIADFDRVSISNLHRQVLYDYDNVGQTKVDVAKQKLKKNNPYVSFQIHSEGIHANNAIDILSEYKIIVDCTDNYATRYLLNDVCVLLNKPLVYGGIHRFEGQVTVFNYQNGPTYRCLFGDNNDKLDGVNCSELGVIGALTSIIGSIQALEVIKLIVGFGDPLSGKLQVYNALNGTMNTFLFESKQHDIYSKIKHAQWLDPKDYPVNCTTESKLELSEILNSYDQIIDVRNEDERPKISHDYVLLIPLIDLESIHLSLDKNKRTLVFCQSGIRSRKAVEILQKTHGFEDVTELIGGIKNYLPSIKTQQTT